MSPIDFIIHKPVCKCAHVNAHKHACPSVGTQKVLGMRVNVNVAEVG